METEKLNELVRELKQIAEENKKLQSSKERLKTLSEHLGIIREQCSVIDGIINPKLLITVGKERNMVYQKTIIPEVYDQLVGGMRIGTKELQRMYPELSSGQVLQLHAKLKRCAGVKAYREGIYSMLFYDGNKELNSTAI